MYRLLHSLERKGYLPLQTERGGSRYRKVYRITPVRIPNGALAIGPPGSDRAGLGFNDGTGITRPTSRGALGRRRADPRVRYSDNPTSPSETD